jgi:hypothetical protein
MLLVMGIVVVGVGNATPLATPRIDTVTAAANNTAQSLVAYDNTLDGALVMEALISAGGARARTEPVSCPQCSPACQADFKKLAGSTAYLFSSTTKYSAMSATAWGAGVACGQPNVIKPCGTLLGPGICCTSNFDWSKLTAEIEAYVTAGQSVVPGGKLMWENSVVAAPVATPGKGNTNLQLIWNHATPLFFPSSCANSGDIAAWTRYMVQINSAAGAKQAYTVTPN